MPRVVVAGLIAVAAVVAGLAAMALGPLDRLENDTVDLRFAMRDAPPPEGVVVVAIDDVTFGDLQAQWPFDRTVHAKAVKALAAAGARAIVYDVQFTEPTEAYADMALYRAVERAGGRVVLGTSEVGPGGTTNVLGGDANLAAAGVRPAHVFLPKDGRGLIRAYTAAVDGLETMPVVAAEVATGRELGATVPEDGALIDFRGPPGTFPTVSFSDVVEDRLPADLVRDAIVVVGAAAPSLQDVHLTPASPDNPMTGPEVQANAIWTVLHGRLAQAPWWVGALAVLVLGAAAPLASLRLRFPWVAAGALALGLAYSGVALLAFRAGTVLPLVVPLVTLAVATLAVGLRGYLVESRERRRAAWLAEVLEGKVHERTAQLRATQLEVVTRLSQASESRDHETGRHVERMSRIAEALGRAAGLDEAEAEQLRHAAVLHDVGKIGVPDDILKKPGRLTDEEREEMQLHTRKGSEILAGSDAPLVRMGELIARTHHERWDGEGYPDGLAGEKIPFAGRICAIADVFDALVSPRRYKRGWSLDEALTELVAQRDRQFDARLVDLFVPIAPALYAELGYGEEPPPAEPAAEHVPTGAAAV